MNTCKTCKWWSIPAPYGGQHLCKKLWGGQAEDHEHLRIPIPRRISISAYGNVVGIYTGPDFGCVNHESK